MRRLILLALATTLLAFVAPQQATAAQSELTAQQQLTLDQRLTSPDGRYFAVLQSDGNFVVYLHGSGAQWASNTVGSGVSRIVMQDDGNLVARDPSGNAKWTTSTNPASGARLVMQNDGNLVLYSRGQIALWASRGGRTNRSQDRVGAPSSLWRGQALWSTDLRFQALMQHDGNFVVYQDGRALWSTNTGSSNAQELRVQTDGNMVLYDSSSGVRWVSRTNPASGATLVMQNDGNLVLYGSGRALWASQTTAGNPSPAVPYSACAIFDSYGCVTQFGYRGAATRPWGYPTDAYGNNCTNYASFRLAQRGVRNPGNLGDASAWATNARRYGIPTGGTPRVGAVAQWSAGHVAIVDWVSPDGSQIAVSETSYGPLRGYRSSSARRVIARTGDWPTTFIYF